MSCKGLGPGPVYMLPPTVGYNKHDPSRNRAPQYSMSPNVYPKGRKNLGPGPAYQIRGVNEHGKFSPPAYSLKSRPKPLSQLQTPGPGAHSPELVPRMKEARPPAYTMQKVWKYGASTIGPGPAYTLPSMLGPKVPNKVAAGAYTIAGRHDMRTKERSPGPANYQGINTNIYKYKRPIYTMSRRVDCKAREFSPGPAAYLPKKLCGEKGFMYSLSPRFTSCFSPFITAEDNMPCMDR